MNAAVEDYRRLAEGAGQAALAGWTCIRVTGADRASFLNNLCTNEIAKLHPGEGCEAFFTDVKGHTLAHVMLLCRPHEILLWTVPEQADPLVRHLDKYLIREDIQLTDLSAEVQLVAVVGRRAAEVLGDSLPAALAVPLASCEALLGGVPTIASVGDWFGPAGFILQVPAESSGLLRACLEKQGAPEIDPAVLEILRVESGTPLFGVDFDARNLPQEVNRNERAIHFAKGCYLGQETVARIDALGHVNKLIVGMKFAAPEVPSAGTVLSREGQEVGAVSSAVWSPRYGRPLALVMVRRGASAPGTVLDSTSGAAEVVGLPPLLDIER